MNKVEELIGMGVQLEKDRIEAVNNSKFKSYMERMKSFSGEQFQEWTSQAMFFLEEQKPASLVTDEMKRKFINLEPSTSYEFYECLQGTLKAVKNQ